MIMIMAVCVGKWSPKQGSVHIQPLCGVSSLHQKSASLILWRKELEKVELHLNGEKLMKPFSKAEKPHSLLPLQHPVCWFIPCASHRARVSLLRLSVPGDCI